MGKLRAVGYVPTSMAESGNHIVCSAQVNIWIVLCNCSCSIDLNGWVLGSHRAVARGDIGFESTQQ